MLIYFFCFCFQYVVNSSLIFVPFIFDHQSCIVCMIVYSFATSECIVLYCNFILPSPTFPSAECSLLSSWQGNIVTVSGSNWQWYVHTYHHFVAFSCNNLTRLFGDLTFHLDISLTFCIGPVNVLTQVGLLFNDVLPRNHIINHQRKLCD